MKAAQTKPRWSWNRWLEFVERSNCSRKTKELAREIPPVMRESGHALAPWTLPSAPGYDQLHQLCYVGALRLIPTVGQFAAIIDPLPERNTIRVTPHQRRILRLLLRGCDLRHHDPGSDYGPPGWEMRKGTFSGIRIRINQRAAEQLRQRGLIEWNGCGSWPTFKQRHYRVNMRRVHGVHGFSAASSRWIKERLKSESPADTSEPTRKRGDQA